MNNKLKYKNVGMEAQLFLIFNTLIMFCGNTFLLNFAPVMMICVVGLLFGMAKIKGFRRYAYRVNCLKEPSVILLGLLTMFIGIQLVTVAYDRNVVFVYFARYVIYTALLIFVPKPELSLAAIKMEKRYGILCGFAYLINVAIADKNAGGLLGNYQAVGMMLSIIAIIYMTEYFEMNKKMITLSLFLFSLLCVFITGKRTFSVLALLSFLLVFYFSNKKDKWINLLKVVVVLGVGVIIAYTLVEPIRELANRLIFADYSDAYTFSSGRNVLWEIAFKIFEEHKVLGIGFGCYPQYSGDFYSNYTNAGLWQPHNIYYGMLCNIGIIGSVIFISFMLISLIKTIKLLKDTYENENYKNICMYSLMIQIWFLIYGYSGNGIFDINEMYFYVVAIAMSLSVAIDKHKYS
ncbi:MAG: O-antigen ligase family protein [Clostridiales bacterium]|nr:O-antigen ligase family protein [Clostridiales bacterium]